MATVERPASSVEPGQRDRYKWVVLTNTTAGVLIATIDSSIVIIGANGSWTYLFGDLDASCAEALIAGARLLAASADGILPWRGRPERLKRGMIARIPPLGFQEIDP